jgi:SAM-dependent methyltransferase
VPTSNPANLTPIGRYLRSYKPRSVLDIGIGFGKWGFLAREFLDVWEGRYRPDQWQVRIEGIEIYNDYISPLHEYIYDEIHIGDVREVVPLITRSFDLVLAIDVLEHLPQFDVLALVAALTERHGVLMANVPAGGILTLHDHMHRFDNDHERHISHWSRRSLHAAGAVQVMSTTVGHLALFTRNSLAPRMRRMTLDGSALADRAGAVHSAWRREGTVATLDLIRNGIARRLYR